MPSPSGRSGSVLLTAKDGDFVGPVHLCRDVDTRYLLPVAVQPLRSEERGSARNLLGVLLVIGYTGSPAGGDILMLFEAI